MKKQLVMGVSVAVGWLPIFWSTDLTWDNRVTKVASPSDLAHWADQMGRLSTQRMMSARARLTRVLCAVDGTESVGG